jgi:hypothetical protein
MSVEVAAGLGQVGPTEASGQANHQVIETGDGLAQGGRAGVGLVFMQEHIATPVELVFDAPV